MFYWFRYVDNLEDRVEQLESLLQKVWLFAIPVCLVLNFVGIGVIASPWRNVLRVGSACRDRKLDQGDVYVYDYHVCYR